MVIRVKWRLEGWVAGPLPDGMILGRLCEEVMLGCHFKVLWLL